MNVSKFVAASVTTASFIGAMGLAIAQSVDNSQNQAPANAPANSATNDSASNMNNRADTNLERGTTGASGELAPRADRG